MSRFSESSIACLKRVMLSRSPEFKFQAEDVVGIFNETGLSAVQIGVWGFNFRTRYTTGEDRMAFLNGLIKETPTKLIRTFVTCFNVSPEFATAFMFPKSRGGGDFGVKYMEAAFNKEAGSGEFFIEFDEHVYDNKLVECFEFQGAGAVMTTTFAHNDGNESAANALVSVFNSQVKTNISYTRGTCTPALLTKVQAKLAAEKLQGSKEFDEKTLAAIKHSLVLQEETKASVSKVEGSLEGVKDSMESQGVKLEGIQHGVCLVIPDYQREIVLLKSQLTHKTALCDRIEGQKGRMTFEINKKIQEIEEGKTEKETLRIGNASVIASLRAEKEAILIEKKEEAKSSAKIIQDLTEKLDICNEIVMLKQTAEILSSAIAEVRNNKRARE